MSESFWSLTAAKRSERQLVPGTSRWVANELNVVDLTIVAETADFALHFKSGIDHINDFMTRISEIYDSGDVLKHQKKLDFLHDIEEETVSASPTRFVNHFTPLRKTDVTSVSTVAPDSLHSSPMLKNWLKGSISHTSSPLKPRPGPLQPVKLPPPTTSLSVQKLETSDTKPPLNADLSFIPAEEAIHARSLRSSAADDSFQAISTAIRKSIAGKVALNLDDSKETLPHISKEPHRVHSDPKSHEVAASVDTPVAPPLLRATTSYKTPKRSSVFVSLPSKEPFPISSNSNGEASMPRFSVKRAERESHAGRAHATPAAGQPSNKPPQTESVPRLSSHYIRKSLQGRVSIRPLALDENSSNPKPLDSNRQLLKLPPRLVQYFETKLLRRESQKLPKFDSTVYLEPFATRNSHDTPSINNSLAINQPEIKKTTSNSSQPKNRSPIFSSIGDFVHRSRNVFMKGATEAKSESRGRLLTTKAEMPVLATSMRATRSPQNSSNRERSPVRQLRVSNTNPPRLAFNRRWSLDRSRSLSPQPAHSGKLQSTMATGGYLSNAIHRSLNAAINSFGILPLKGAPVLASDQKTSTATTSPKKATAVPSINKENTVADAKPVLLEEREVPNSMKKKSIMAERSEAAAMRPKQKIKIGMNHKVHKIPIIPPPSQPKKTFQVGKEETRVLSSQVKLDHNLTRRITEQNSLKRDTFGKEAPEKESRKSEHVRRHTEKRERGIAFPKGSGNSVPLPDAARGRFTRNDSVKRIKTSKNKTPLRVPMSVSGHNDDDPYRTPGKRRYSAGSLPAINTDDEDAGKQPALSPWAESPQLLKIVQLAADIDPVTIFGEIPKLRIEEVFESQASRHRARPSPGGY